MKLVGLQRRKIYIYIYGVKEVLPYYQTRVSWNTKRVFLLHLDFPLPCVSGTPQYSSVHYIHRQKFSVNLFISSRRVQLQEIKVHIKIQTHTLRAVQGQ